MAERIIRPLTEEGRVTIPKELREKYNLKDYVEIVEADDGILIKAH
jgi:AbrB family looped-hinge helix DNA binding protein